MPPRVVMYWALQLGVCLETRVVGLSQLDWMEVLFVGLTLSRHELEDDLELLGLLLFRNEVKPDSARYIDVLKTGGVDNVMITGDSVYNGAAVARKVGIIPHGYR